MGPTLGTRHSVGNGSEAILHDACMAEAHPVLIGGPVGRGPTTSVALVLHGGREIGTMPTTRTQTSYLRMLDFVWGLRRRSTGCAIYRLRYRVRGWNPDQVMPDPVQDAHWALDQLAERHTGVPMALLGHSMGGRTAFAVSGREEVTGVCGLAPWLPEGEPLPPTVRPEQRFVIAHGTSDRMTSSPLSREYAARMRAAGHRVARFELPGARHALLDRPGLWRSFAVRTTLGLVDDAPMPPGVAAALGTTSTDDFDLALDGYDGLA